MLERRKPWGRSLVVVLLTSLGLQTTTWAAGEGRDLAVEQKLAEPLAPIDPGLPAQFSLATGLLDEGKLAEAKAAYETVLAQAPEHAPTLWRLSGIARRDENKADALAYARRALSAQAVWQAKHSLVEALMMPPAEPLELAQAQRLVAELLAEHESAESSALAVTLALQMGDRSKLNSAVRRLQSQAPEHPQTHYFLAIFHADRDELDEAHSAIERAVSLGFPADVAREFEASSGITAHLNRWRQVRWGLAILAAWLLGLALLFVAGCVLSNSALRAVEAAAGDARLLELKTRGFRRAYGYLIGVGAAYYFISIPIVLAVVVLLVVGVVMAFFAIGRIPIKLVLVLGFGALVSVWSMLRSLFVKRGPDEAPGRLLTENEAPALWQLLREVAARVNTRPVDAVYLTAGTDLAVTETGSMVKRLRDQGMRSLILGLGVLPGMTQAQLAAILAHEYGHFSNRDTARGDVALIVQASLYRSAVGIAQGGGASWINPAWIFINGFHGLFLRITHGASRLQEVMADRFAAMAYGAPGFSEGLVHAIRRSLEFSHNTNQLVTDAERTRRPIANLYATAETVHAQSIEARNEQAPSIEAALEQALNDPGSPYDSHPPPTKRIDWVNRMATASGWTVAADAKAAHAWDLFATKDALENEMTLKVNESLSEQGIIDHHSTQVQRDAVFEEGSLGTVILHRN